MAERDSAELSIRGAMRVLALAVAFFVVMDLVALTFTMVTGHDYALGILPIFDLDKERGVSMLFQSWLFLGNAGLFALVARARREKAEGIWVFLAWLFVFLAVDEFAVLHERLMPVMNELLGETSGLLYFTWIVPYGILVCLLAIWVAPKIFRLPDPSRWRLIAAAVTYVTGALVFEAIGGWRLSGIGGEAARPEFWYEFITTIEESLEMVGLILLTYGLLELLRQAHPSFRIQITE